ncbi:NUDIX hydrolase [Nocardia mexicana]|uniref:ADP-ribose pyrophosphatase YjhB (NUDIX family) n=1 Tax=Nocardia mexicana TaxID=279262 RepID=A0A370HEM0_9NOCA|nr:NUDIX domain-containing protein [Nocardia mexicana]RDI53333.1 ADP-ribose pyrophosphatase YjhB (NUDIX family) [Nocardia mexicana]
MSDTTHFQYCQKLVVIDPAANRVLLARRKGEADYDGVYSLIGGKMETTDGSILDAIRREKEEEIGKAPTISIAEDISYNVHFRKKDGNSMILPHFYAEYEGGDIELNDEYSDYAWVPVDQLGEFEPKIDTIPAAVRWATEIGATVKKSRGLTRL